MEECMGNLRCNRALAYLQLEADGGFYSLGEVDHGIKQIHGFGLFGGV